MSDTHDPTTDALTHALLALINTPSNPTMEQARTLLAQRLAATGGIVPSRIPAPRNITEVGGYLNLLEDAGQPELRLSAISAALGIAGPLPSAVFVPTPPLFFASRRNVADDVALDGAVPRSYRVRSDFGAAWDAAMQAVEDLGGAVQWLDLPLSLPPWVLGGPAPSTTLSDLGRVMTVVPGSALRDPLTDRVALGTRGPTTELFVRVRDNTAPQSSSVVAAPLDVWTCTPLTCTQAPQTQAWFALAPLLAQAGWAPAAPQELPTSALLVGNVFRFVNLTGLVAGVTTLREELLTIWTADQVHASVYRDHGALVWNGTRFA